MVKNRIKNFETGEVTYETIAPIPDVPVLWQAGGGMSFIMNLEAGDNVILIVADRSIDEWQNSSRSKPSEPFSSRRYDLSDAIAIPGGQPPAGSLDSSHYASDGAVLKVPKLYIGDSSASKALAIAEAVEAKLNEMINNFNNHIHVSADPGSPTTVPTPLMTSTTPGEFDSGKVFTND